MQRKPIGIFDSGVGGLTVLKELVNIMPYENYLYFGDTARIPYGEKTKEQLFAYVRGIMEWFKSQNVKGVVMACNSSSAVTYETIKEEYDFPVYNLIEPTAEYISYLDTEKIGVMATSVTVNSKAYSKIIKKSSSDKTVIEVACPGLVEMIENNKSNSNDAKKLVIKYVAPLLEKGAEKIVLGCTHYPFLSQVITAITGDKDMLIDPARHLAENVADDLMLSEMLNPNEKGLRQYFASANPQMFVEAGQKFYSDLQEAEELSIGEVTSVAK